MTTEEIIGKTLEFEGGYVNDPEDAGGETKYGISKRQYPTLDIKNLTKEKAIEIYKKDYFDRIGLSAITDSSVSWKLFDIAVNMGTGTSVRLAQQVVGEKEDGVMGAKTLAAINQMDSTSFLKELSKKQLFRYADICAKTPSNIKFLKGWMNRALDY